MNYWFECNHDERKGVNLIPLIYGSAIEQYRQQGHWVEAIQCAITIGNWPLAIELVCQASRYFSRKGKYDQARQLMQQLPKETKRFSLLNSQATSGQNQQLLLLALFENLLDFQQYGHQVASINLTSILNEYPTGALAEQSKELIVLLEHHYSYLLQAKQGKGSLPSISQYTQLFDPSNELCAWAWHSLAMEQVLAGGLVNSLESIMKAIYWSFEQEDAPCALASLAWIVVPCLHLGKLSFALEYCSKVELWLQDKQLSNIAMVSTIHRVRLLIYREQGYIELAQQESKMMKTFYAELDPLNLAYCYWAEFLLSLAEQKFDQARKQLLNLEGHVLTHFDSWQLALPQPELLSAVIDNLAGSELAMLNWASQFQLQHIEDNEGWINKTSPAYQSEIIAYIRVRIVLGSDMLESCEQLLSKANSQYDILLSLHITILLLLNANRQDNDAAQKGYRHRLLITAGKYDYQQVYKEYLDDLLPLLIQQEPLPSELLGYEKIVPFSVREDDKSGELNSAAVDIEDHIVFDSLTAREKQIALQVLAGHSNKEIAENSAIALVTVKGHVSNIFNKLGIKRRAQLANLLSSSIE